MLETGNIHLVEAMNGSIYFKDVAIVQPNSYWACDQINCQMLVLADNGQASLFDISFGSNDLFNIRNNKQSNENFQ